MRPRALDWQPVDSDPICTFQGATAGKVDTTRAKANHSLLLIAPTTANNQVQILLHHVECNPDVESGEGSRETPDSMHSKNCRGRLLPKRQLN